MSLSVEDVDELNGYMRLFAGILKMAIRDYVYHSPREEEYQTAYIWLFEEDENHEWRKDRLEATGGYSTSFEGICELFNIDIEWMRKKIKEMRSSDARLRPDNAISQRPIATEEEIKSLVVSELRELLSGVLVYEPK
jgi:hypothetical protein